MGSATTNIRFALRRAGMSPGSGTLVVSVVAAASLPLPEPPVPPSSVELEDLLRPLAAQLIWWQPADLSLRNPDRVIAQVLPRAEASWFSPRSWNDWQQKLGLARSGAVPPLPQRHFGGCDGSHHAAD